MPPKIPEVRTVERADQSGEPKDIRYGMRVLRSNPRFAVVARQRHSWSEPRFRRIPEFPNPFSIAPQTKTRIETTVGSWDSQNALNESGVFFFE